VSQETVQIVRSVWEAAQRGDNEAVFALYDPAIVWDQSTLSGPTAGVHHGHEGVRQFWRQWLESFETHHVRAETFIDAAPSTG
jgi:ketosteroid isomerase-like protein